MYKILFIFLVIFVAQNARCNDLKLAKPVNGQIYHAAFPDFGGFEDTVTTTRITDFEQLAGKNITWAYFSDNWFDGIHFPLAEVTTIQNSGHLPFIRIMPRNQNEDTPDPVYTMDAFLNGDFDADLSQWAIDAKNFAQPLLLEFGTEVNGNWFPWNGQYAGAGNTNTYGDANLYDGAEKFRDVYRHIIDIFRINNVTNITWFFHVNVENSPNVAWNKMKNYYPGDDYIDWIGISVYGPQDNLDGWWSFASLLSANWQEIQQISNSNKPIAILELGVIDDASLGNKAQWISDAYASVSANGFFAGQIQAMSYWHENFGCTNLRIDSSPQALSAYQNAVAQAQFIATPVFMDIDLIFANGFE